MANAHFWSEIKAKLIHLDPDDVERGKIRRAVFELDESKVFRYFDDTDNAVKATLDALISPGMP